MAPKLSKRSVTKGIKLKAIHYYYDNGTSVNEASNNKWKVGKKQMRNWVKSKDGVKTATKTDFTISAKWKSNVTYNGERTEQKIYQFEKRRKADQKMVIYKEN